MRISRLFSFLQINFRLPFCGRKARMKAILNYCILFVLLINLGCKKTQLTEGVPLIPLSQHSKDLSLNKYSKVIVGSYGVLTADQRFESTDIVQLHSGALLAILSNTFENKDKTTLFKCYSYDNGKTWTTPQDVNLPITDYSFTACNLFRVRSRLFLVMNRVSNTRATYEGGIPAISYSDDEGASWSKPALMLNSREKEIVIMNARNITITRTGRIIVPIAHGQIGTRGFTISLIYSDNNGRSWNLTQNLFTSVNTRKAMFAEPSIGHLNDGRLVMFIRTALGYIFKSYSSDNGATWTTPVSTPLVSPWTAHSIKITKNGYIVIAYTNSIAGADCGYPRNNLKFAVSYDNGETWKPSGTIFEIPVSFHEFVMEPNIVFLPNDKCLVTFYHKLNSESHQIETAIFKKQAILRDEENWQDLHWWQTDGNSSIRTVNNILHLASNGTSTAKVYKRQMIANRYSLEFRAKINSFVEPGSVTNYSTLLLEVVNRSYKLSLKLESNGIYIKDNTGNLAKHSIATYQIKKSDWHVWRLEVFDGKLQLFMDGKSVIESFYLPAASGETEGISYSTNSNLPIQSSCDIDYSYYDPL